MERFVPKGQIIIDDATEHVRCQFVAHLKVGEKVPGQLDCERLLGIKMGTYSKILRRLAKDHVVTKIGYGIGYVYGEPSEAQVANIVAAHREDGRKKLHILSKMGDKATLQKAVNSRALRHEIRLKCAMAISEEGLDRHLVQALRDHDLEHMRCCEVAMKLIGVDFDHSEEAQEIASKQLANAAAAVAAVNIAFRPAQGGGDAIKTEYVEVDNAD